MRRSSPGVVGRGRASVPSRFRGEAKALRGLRTNPRELAFGLLRTLPMDCPALEPPQLPPPLPARLAMPALTRPVATAPQIGNAAYILDDMSAWLSCNGALLANTSNHPPIHPHEADFPRAVPQEAGIRRGRAGHIEQNHCFRI